MVCDDAGCCSRVVALLLVFRRAVMLVLDNAGVFLKTDSDMGWAPMRGRGRRAWLGGRRQLYRAGLKLVSWQGIEAIQSTSRGHEAVSTPRADAASTAAPVPGRHERLVAVAATAEGGAAGADDRKRRAERRSDACSFKVAGRPYQCVKARPLKRPEASWLRGRCSGASRRTVGLEASPVGARAAVLLQDRRHCKPAAMPSSSVSLYLYNGSCRKLRLGRRWKGPPSGI